MSHDDLLYRLLADAPLQRWRAQYGGLKADDAKRLKELGRENARSKGIVADQMLENQALKEIAKGACSDTSNCFATTATSCPSPRRRSASRNFLMICSGECRRRLDDPIAPIVLLPTHGR